MTVLERVLIVAAVAGTAALLLRIVFWLADRATARRQRREEETLLDAIERERWHDERDGWDATAETVVAVTHHIHTAWTRRYIVTEDDEEIDVPEHDPVPGVAWHGTRWPTPPPRPLAWLACPPVGRALRPQWSVTS